MPSFTELRDELMVRHGWCRRVATLAARLRLGVDTVADLEAAERGRFRSPLLSQAEYREVCRASGIILTTNTN
jgi:hypothetical protein